MVLPNSLDALNDFATLHGLFIKFGGEVAKAHKVSAPWVSIQIGNEAARRACEGESVIEITQDFYRDFAALAGEFEKLLANRA